MNAHPLVQCRAKLAANAGAQPLDVMKTKSVLQTLGHYDAPEWGVSPYPEPALFDAIKAFQKSQGLKVDGVINPDGETEAALSTTMTPRRATTALKTTAQALQAMGRGGDELLAHITHAEAQLLHRITDGGSINPQTGLLEFFWGGSDRDDDGNGYDNDAQHGESDASAAEASDAQAAENDRQGMSADNGGRDDSPRASNAGPAGRGQGTSLNATTTMTVTLEDGEAKTEKTRTNRTKAQPTEDQSFSSGFFDTNEEDEDDLDAQHGYTDPPSASDDQAVENDHQDNAMSARDHGDPAGYGDMSSVDAINKKASAPVLDWGPQNPYWSSGLNPNAPPPDYLGPNPASPPDERKEKPAPKAPKSRPGDLEYQAIQKALIDKFYRSTMSLLGELGIAGLNNISPMMMLPGTKEIIEEERNKTKNLLDTPA